MKINKMTLLTLRLDHLSGILNIVGTVENNNIDVDSKIFINGVGSQPSNFQGNQQFPTTGDKYTLQTLYDYFFNIVRNKDIRNYKITLEVQTQ